MLQVLQFIILFALGFTIALLFLRRGKRAGTFYIEGEGEEYKVLMELDEDLKELKKAKRIVFEVGHKIPRE